MFRIGGNITLDDSEVVQGQSFKLNIGNKKDCLSFIQYLKPLSVENPFYYVQIKSIIPEGVVTIGVASLDINENSVPGCWNNTIGYESSTGHCFSSHRVNANTFGRPVLKDDTFGIFISNFGMFQSTVLFLHNNEPVATRYHFESDHSKYLPTITFENGPMEVDVYWQPFLNTTSLFQWIKPSNEICIKLDDGLYENISKQEDMPLQNAMPLSKINPHYKCIQLEVNEDGQGASVGIASCSPLKPTPTCSLLRDYYTWLPKMKLKHGNSIGWGIIYDPDEPNLNDKEEQLALVFVTFNDSIVDVLFVLQPEGGFYPLVLMQPWAKKVKLEISSTIKQEDLNKLTKLFYSKLQPALEIKNKNLETSIIEEKDLRISSENVYITIENNKTIIKIPSNKPGLHYIQYKKPLTPERRFCFIEINKMRTNSNVVLGVAPPSLLDENSNKLPGEAKDTIGYHSKTGFMLYNGKSHGNMMGHKCARGDTMGLEMEIFDKEMSVAIFSKNFKPIGTRFLTLKEFDFFLPTIGIMSTGEQIEINVYWHTVVSMPPHFNIRNPEDWCYPEGTKIDKTEKIFILPHHYDHSLCIQAPYSLHHKYNHFEIILVDDFDKNSPPPAIALCTACPFDPPPISQFKQDYLRFWPTGDAMSAVKKNDRLGWGIYYAEENTQRNQEHLMICFLTINRQVVYLRVLFQPPGGFYPVVIAPPNVYKIKMDFMANRVGTEDFATEQIKSILFDAHRQIEFEKKLISEGKNPREQNDDTKRSKMCNIL